MAKRKKYSDEFKREAVGLIRQPGSKVTQVAADIGVTATQLFRWRRELDRGDGKAFPGSGVARDQEMLALVNADPILTHLVPQSLIEI